MLFETHRSLSLPSSPPLLPPHCLSSPSLPVSLPQCVYVCLMSMYVCMYAYISVCMCVSNRGCLQVPFPITTPMYFMRQDLLLSPIWLVWLASSPKDPPSPPAKCWDHKRITNPTLPYRGVGHLNLATHSCVSSTSYIEVPLYPKTHFFN